MVTGANKPFHRQDSNNTVSQNAHLIADPKNPSQDPVNQIALAMRNLQIVTPNHHFYTRKTHSQSTRIWKRMKTLKILQFFFIQHLKRNPT